jgi:iron complex outermembrane receptor protein
MNLRHKTALLTGLSLAVLATPALAQTASPAAPQATDAASDGAIVVTAQRRAEKVTEVPISITVADASQLERQQVNTVNDLNRIAPSLEIQSAPGQNTGGGGAIRGIGTQTFSPGAVASVGVVVDQVSQGNANISDLFDVARIEVLKGPQGTLFGLTTSAGVINITTNKPEFDKVRCACAPNCRPPGLPDRSRATRWSRAWPTCRSPIMPRSAWPAMPTAPGAGLQPDHRQV